MSQTKRVVRKKASRRTGLTAAKLDQLIAEATVDAYDQSEQTTGFLTMFEEHLILPFKTEVLGVEVTVETIDLTDEEEIVAVCARGNSRQRISITELPLPDQQPLGWEWIDAYRRWLRGR